MTSRHWCMYSAFMVALQIRDVPEEVRDRLADAAKSRGQSLQAYLLALVTDEARRARNIAILERMAQRDDGSRLTATESAAARHRERKERDERGDHVMRPIGRAGDAR